MFIKLMKMKNLFLGLSLLAIAGMWTGCSNNDVVVDTPNGDQPISFRVQGGLPTLRSTGTTAAYVNAFVVYGTTDNLTAANIFNGTTVARQAGSGDFFDYNPKKYYPAGSTDAEFAAYSPVSKKISTSPAPAFLFGTGLTFNYEVVVPDNTGNTTQEDLLVAGTSVDVTSLSLPSSNVKFAFQHALSRIFVKATNSSNETIVIKSLKLKNLFSTGKITGTPGATWAWDWSSFGGKKDYTYVLAPTGVAVQANVGMSTLVTSMEQGMMVLPQETVNTGDDVSAGDFALEVEFDIGNASFTENVYLTDGYPFVRGNQYAITIDFSGPAPLIEINFEITVDDFDTIIELP
jgi:hypothetical protein